jgi:glutamine---fructose-6-phosphate transaminase (isomerizing)
MCGIFGLTLTPESSLSSDGIEKIIQLLFRFSESRGSEAAGIAFGGLDSIAVFRRAQSSRQMIRTPDFRSFLMTNLSAENSSQGLTVIGHSRLVTNGTQSIEENNQPVSTAHFVGVHNGIVTNSRKLIDTHQDIQCLSQLDSEVIYQLLEKYYIKDGHSLPHAITKTFHDLKGEASIGFLNGTEHSLCIATNVGSLYFASLPKQGIFIFASEGYFIQEILSQSHLSSDNRVSICQLKPNQAMIVQSSNLSKLEFSLEKNKEKADHQVPIRRKRRIVDQSPKLSELKLCTRCILPHTFPFIEFDDQGVCNYCIVALQPKLDSKKNMDQLLSKFGRKDVKPDCIVALSGGRDSCYGLHVLKKELGLNPIAFTYDWGMVTNEARRNCARICGELGIEHIVRSSNILSKRRNIRLNIEAWLKKPELGMIPLFMSGDKQFFHYAYQVSQQTKIPNVIFCGGNSLEITRFKTGFCGVMDNSINGMMELDHYGKIKLAAYYAKNLLLNPGYLNRSVFDSLFAFYTTYINRKDFIYLYHYINWNEKVIADTLSNLYGWESSEDSASTWRIGDGTAAFYNYIYYTIAGFSEHDTFRSNQIRAGLITRKEGMEKVKDENKTRFSTMQAYAGMVGFSLDEALVVINNVPKLY